MRARGLTVPLLCSLAIVAGAPAALAGGTSLYSGPGPRPGPDVLYGAPAVAPQLENVGVWSAAPILVSGASAYRGGEFLYQDFLYDDHGADEAPDPTDPKGGGNLFSKPDGTYTYPTDPAYANDAADLVELRVKPLSDATAFRLTLNTLNDASLVAFSIAIGGTPGVLRSFPAGANVQAPADLFLTVHPAGTGMAGDLVDAATGQPVAGPAPLVAVDTGRRQIEVRVPHAAWPPAWACGTRRTAATCCRRPRPTRPTRAAPERRSARPLSSTSPSATTSRCRSWATRPTRPRARPGGATSTRARRSPPATSARSMPTSTSRSSPPRSTTTCAASRAACRRPAPWTASW